MYYFLVDCEWNDWSDWSQCTATCDGGFQFRNRTRKQDAKHGGDQCLGAYNETRSCNTQDCPSMRS